MKHPSTFRSGDDFYNYVHYKMGLADPHCEEQGGGAWIAFDGDQPVGTYDESSGVADFDPASFVEADASTTTYEPMQLLKEMLMMEAKKVPLKKAAKSVYHRDYLRTKNKPYRKYDPKKHQRNKGDAE